MATPPKAPKLAPAAGRSWLTYGIGIFLVLIGVGLAYRQITGNTSSDQRRQARIAKEAKELAEKPPANSEGFSARLDERRKALEQKAALAALELAKDLSGTAPSPSASAPASVATTARAIGNKGQMPDDQELEAYAAAKQALVYEATKDASRRMAAWESGTSGVSGAPGASWGRQGVDEAVRQAPASRTSPSLDLMNTLKQAAQAGQGGASAASATDQDAEFLKRTSATSSGNPSEPIRAQRGHGRYALLEGGSLEVAMMTAVSSDMGGACRAQVTHDVFDTVTGMDRLIPAGATLICTYNSSVQAGQERLLLAFTRLIYPNGATVALGAMQGGDMQGVMGAPAAVNSRFWQIFGSSLLVASVSTVASIQQAKAAAGSGGSVNVNLGTVMGGASAGVLTDVTNKMMARNLNIKPELRLSLGDRLQVVVSQDMVLDPSITGLGRMRQTD